jgi:hypothetical protein
MIKVFAGKVRKTGFFQKAGFPGNSDTIFGICYNCHRGMISARLTSATLFKGHAGQVSKSQSGIESRSESPLSQRMNDCI